MPRFNGQNKKKTDPRYFSEELLEEQENPYAAPMSREGDLYTRKNLKRVHQEIVAGMKKKGYEGDDLPTYNQIYNWPKKKIINYHKSYTGVFAKERAEAKAAATKGAQAVHKAAFAKRMAEFEKAGYTGQSLVDNEVWTKAACPKCKYGRDENGIFKKSTSGVRYFKSDSKAGRQILKAIKGLRSTNLAQFAPAVDQGLAEQLTAQKLKQIIKEEVRRVLALKNKIKLTEQIYLGKQLFGGRARDPNARYSKVDGKFYKNGKPANARQARQLAKRWPKAAAPAASLEDQYKKLYASFSADISAGRTGGAYAEEYSNKVAQIQALRKKMEAQKAVTRPAAPAARAWPEDLIDWSLQDPEFDAKWKASAKAKKAAKAEAHDKAFRLARQKEYCAGQGLGMAPDGKCIGKNIVGGAKQEA